jgi:hypothetical protein
MAYTDIQLAYRKLFIPGPARRPVYTGWLFFFRINVAGFALLHYLSVQPDFADLYSYKGYVYPDILDASYDHLSFTITSLQFFLQKLHIAISYESLLLICRFAYPVALVLLITGLFTRAGAIASLFFQLLFIKSIHLYEYGIDYFTTVALFYCCIFPVGKVFSIDNKLRKHPKEPVNHDLFLLLLRANLSIAYFFSGFDKIIGESWRNGEAIWKALHSHNYYNLFSLDFLPASFFLLAGWGTLLLEMCYPLFINIIATRKYWLWGIIGMHIFIALFMGLFFFSALMIILNLSAFYAPYISKEKWVFKK